ncbi:EthD family reductase [Methylopila sp. M107]|uniref:EthD family reductase n=1 Tax=Methylopila sp. M107 TaxID=1101190 RepID=UPI00039BAFA1|nr:EthD family reductase [Methylopila sp. M107]
MSTKLVVMYPKPKDPAAFDSYFRGTHMPLVRKMPGLGAHSFGPSTGPDGGEGAYFWIFVGTFESPDALGAALSSPEGQTAVADIPNYSTGGDPTIAVIDATEG